jgi:hypothetical protein
MPMQSRGCDYSWDRPDLNCLWGKGARFIVRYGSRDTSKNLSKSELNSALAVGMGVAVVWQEGKTQMLRGYSGGQTDARDAVALFDGLGLPGIPIYFSCDQDYEACSSADKTKINDYCNGAKSIVGKSRMGGYGDDTFCKVQLDAGRIIYGWQTYAWSEGQWEPRCQLRQVQNNVTVCGGKIDWDESWATDFGQWPRPLAAGPSADGVLISPSIAYYQDKAYYAYIDTTGRVCVNGGVVDPASNAKSGVGLAINQNTGRKVIIYTNQGDKLCTYTQEPGSNVWAWTNKEWNAK